MSERTSQIEWDIVAKRRELGRNLQELENKAKALADWRMYYHNHPLAILGIALGGGLLLGAFTGRTVRGREFSAYGEANESPAASPRSSSTARVRRHVGDTWDQIMDALLGVASAKAIEIVGEMVPGFRDQYSARHPEQGPFSSEHIREA